jgi:hypothetical protein
MPSVQLIRGVGWRRSFNAQRMAQYPEPVITQPYHPTYRPGFYLFNSDRLLVYRVQIDSSRPGEALI